MKWNNVGQTIVRIEHKHRHTQTIAHTHMCTHRRRVSDRENWEREKVREIKKNQEKEKKIKKDKKREDDREKDKERGCERRAAWHQYGSCETC